MQPRLFGLLLAAVLPLTAVGPPPASAQASGLPAGASVVRDGNDIARVMAEAFHIASSGRPGPVLVDIPKDVLQGQCTFSWPPQFELPGYKPNTKPHSRQVREAAKLIAAGASELEAAEVCILAPLSSDGAIANGLRELAAATLLACR